MKERLLLTGGSGLIGAYIITKYSGGGELTAPRRKELDVTAPESVETFFERVKPNVVIHAAALTRILPSEDERGDKGGKFWQTNVEGTRSIIKNCIQHNSFLVFISAEIVFAGTKDRPGPHSEDDLTEDDPRLLSWYGWTKREAERLIREEMKDNAAIVRLSSVVGKGKQPRPDYARKILNAYDEGRLTPMFADQYIGLTDVDEFLVVLEKLVEGKLSGIFHVASPDQFSPFEFARYLLAKTREVKEVVKSGSIVEYLKAHPATFPQFSGLKSGKTQKLLGVKFSPWRKIVDKISPELKRP